MSGYDPTTDPYYISEEVQAISEETERATLSQELLILAEQMETFATPGWRRIEAQFFEELQDAAKELIIFRPNRSPADFAFVQGQIAKVQALLSLEARVRRRHAELSEQLEELQNPALA